MYKKILLCVLLIFSILITGCGKTELSDIETATLYMNAAYSGDATIAKGTGLEDEVSAFVYNVDKRIHDVLVYDILSVTLRAMVATTVGIIKISPPIVGVPSFSL